MSERISKINLYFLNCCSLEKFENVYVDGIIDDFTVEFKERIDMSNFNEKIMILRQSFLEKYDVHIDEIHLMDNNYTINHYYTEKGRKHFNDLKTAVENQGENLFINDANTYEEFEKMNFSNDRAHFIADYETFSDEFHFMDNISKCFDNNIFIFWGLRKIEDILSAKCYYDPFSGKKIAISRDCFGMDIFHNPNSIQCFFEFALTQTHYLIEAGFMNRERFVQKAIPAWALNINSCMFSRGVILRYGLFPRSSYTTDGNIEYRFEVMEMFCESADYRYQITDAMLKIVVKLSKNLGFVSNTSNYRLVNIPTILQRIFEIKKNNSI